MPSLSRARKIFEAVKLILPAQVQPSVDEIVIEAILDRDGYPIKILYSVGSNKRWSAALAAASPYEKNVILEAVRDILRANQKALEIEKSPDKVRLKIDLSDESIAVSYRAHSSKTWSELSALRA
jgi:hypothetical protein